MQKLAEMTRRHTGTLRAALGAFGAVLALCVALWLGAPGLNAQTAQNPPSEQFEVISGQLLVDDQTQKATFEGDVTATWGEWTLRCQAIHITYGENGQIIEAKAEGSPLILSWSGGVIEAKRARFEPRSATPTAESLTQGTLWLEGDPVLRRGQSRISGASVEVNLRSRKVRVEGVRGVLAPQDF